MDAPAEPTPGRGEWLRLIRRRLQHGVPPLTLEECRTLYELATGDTIDQRKRCPRCEGTGTVASIRRKSFGKWMVATLMEDQECPECAGTGYIRRETADF